MKEEIERKIEKTIMELGWIMSDMEKVIEEIGRKDRIDEYELLRWKRRKNAVSELLEELT